MPLTALDWLILIVFAGGLVHGFMVGAVRQLVSLFGLLVAFLFALQFMRPVGALLVNSLGLSPELGPFVGFIVLFIAVQLLFGALSRLLERLVATLSLTFVNRAAGGGVGGGKAILILSLLFFVLAGIDVPSEETREQSVLYEPVASALPQTLEVVAGWLPAVKEASDEWGRQLRPQLEPSQDREAFRENSPDEVPFASEFLAPPL